MPTLLVALLLWTAAPACGDSNSEIDTPKAEDGGPGSDADTAGELDAAIVDEDGGPTDCPEQYTLALHVVMKSTWKETLGIEAGSDDVHIWARLAVDSSGQTETISCGSVTPSVTTRVIPGLAPIAYDVLAEIPDETWDRSTMPKLVGVLARSDSRAMFEPGVSLLGFSLEDPEIAWPARADELTPVDHDDDGKPGLTTVPRDGDGYLPQPVSINDLGPEGMRIDRMYIAQRTDIAYTASIEGCPRRFRGSANVRRFEYHVVGCHVRDGSDCDEAEAQFADEQRPVFPTGPASFDAKMIPNSSSCADVRAALPAP